MTWSIVAKPWGFSFGFAVADGLEVGREEGVGSRALDEAERDVVERRRDVEGAERPAAVLVRLDVREERRAPRVEERPRRADVPDPERERRDAVGVDPQVARRAGVLRDGRRDEDADLARAEDGGLLAPLLHLRARGARRPR